MPLPAGTCIGPYEVTGAIGAGGMGEVYRARDTKLNRDVALKVLPETFASDPERLARFKREAQILASLNHPNIATIHGFEDAPSASSGQAGVHALVMELVEGPTLAEVIAGSGLKAQGLGRLGLDDALRIARQIADALEAAHEQGIVHRDLKPANVKVRPDGTVKVLDFGLAKAIDPAFASNASAGQAGDVSNSPTITSPAQTLQGTILGTAAYMSPEQARGKPADKRADIWAFGVVLYEMVTGRQLFQGEHVTDVLAAIVRDTPDLSGVPPAVRRLLEKCLEKDPRHRLRDISGVSLLLEPSSSGPISVASPPPIVVRKTSRLVPALAVGAVLIAIGAGVWWWFGRSVIDSTGVEFAVHAPTDTPLAEPYSIAAVSPDGRHLLFGTSVVNNAGTGKTLTTRGLWVRTLESATVRLLPGTEAATAAIWSPDSQSIAFLGDRTLRRVALGGGPPITIAKVPDADLYDGGAWSEHGVVLLGCGCGLDRVDVATGDVKRLRAADKAAKERGFSSPQFLPGGERFLYQVVSDDPALQGTYVSTLGRPEERTLLLKIAGKAVYAPPIGGRGGHLLWTADDTLMARPFAADSLTFGGEAVAIAEHVAFSDLSTQQYSWERAAFWVSTNGLLVYAPAVEAPRAKMPLAWVDRNGRILGDVAPEGPYGAIAVSPDGRRAALTRTGIRRTAEPNGDIWLWDFATEAMSRLTFDPATDENPVWSPDGQQIAFSSNRDRFYQVYRKNASGAGDEERITNVTRNTDPLAWSPDGRYLVYRQLNPGTGWDLMAVPLFGDRKPEVLVQSPESDSDARFSPDGRFLTYHSRMNGRSLEVYAQAFHGGGQPGLTGPRLQISNNSGFLPIWSRSGREIFYNQLSDSKLMSAAVQMSPTLRVEKPRELFPTPMNVGPLHAYDVSADDQRFLMMLKRRRAPETLHLNVVTNWHRLLSR